MSAIEPTASATDRRLAATPIWRCLALPVIDIALLLAIAAWAIISTQADRVHRAAATKLNIALLTKGPFADFIAVRAIVASVTTISLSTDQDRIVSD